jgi:hypothetical protein
MNYKLKKQLSWLKAEIMITAGERSVACGSEPEKDGNMDCFGLRPRNDGSLARKGERPRNDERKVNEWTG